MYGNHFGVFGDCLLLQVVVLVDTTNFWSYEDTSCAEFYSNGFITPYLQLCWNYLCFHSSSDEPSQSNGAIILKETPSTSTTFTNHTHRVIQKETLEKTMRR